MRDANCFKVVLSPVGELLRVVQYQHQSISSLDPFSGALEMIRQDVFIADLRVREESLGRFRVGPVLAGKRNRLADSVGEPLQQRGESLIDTTLIEAASRYLALNPVFR